MKKLKLLVLCITVFSITSFAVVPVRPCMPIRTVTPVRTSTPIRTVTPVKTNTIKPVTVPIKTQTTGIKTYPTVTRETIIMNSKSPYYGNRIPAYNYNTTMLVWFCIINNNKTHKADTIKANTKEELIKIIEGK